VSTLRASLPADSGGMARLTGDIERFAATADIAPTVVARLLTVLDEIVTNIVTHGGLAPPLAIEVEMQRDSRHVAVVVEDAGRPFDPIADAPAPGLDGGLEERRIGGLGLHILRMLTTDLAYRRTPEGRNRLSFKIAA
jgi:anti-sigma regulatory factor (Ser/Thr protein kinase)